MTALRNDAASNTAGTFEALLRAGFPYEKTLGMRRITWYPIDIALGGEGRIYCLRRGPFEVGGVICSINWDDEDLGVIRPPVEPGGDEGLESGWLWPVGIVCDPDERLIVSDEAAHTITVMTREGEQVACWGEHGSEPGQLDRPAHMAFDTEGYLLVVDTMNHRVQRFTLEGKYIDGFGTRGSGPGQLDMPWGIALDAEGCVYIGDWRNDRVQKFSPSGEPLLSKRPRHAVRPQRPLRRALHRRRHHLEVGTGLSHGQRQGAAAARDDHARGAEALPSSGLGPHRRRPALCRRLRLPPRAGLPEGGLSAVGGRGDAAPGGAQPRDGLAGAMPWDRLARIRRDLE